MLDSHQTLSSFSAVKALLWVTFNYLRSSFVPVYSLAQTRAETKHTVYLTLFCNKDTSSNTYHDVSLTNKMY